MRLIISEKDSTAKRISSILSKGKVSADKIDGVPVYSFAVNGTDNRMVGLKGHILKIDYPQKYSKWQDVKPIELVDAPLTKVVSQRKIANVLKKVAKDADSVVIATDFDREGELIGVEALNKVHEVTNSVPSKRARFSSLTDYEINKAFDNLEEIYYDLANAGQARQEIDLIWGATLTRFISLASMRLGKSFISAGRVQSPTLALIVGREKERQAFVPTPYWQIKAQFETDDNVRFAAAHKIDRFTIKEEVEKARAGVAADAEVADIKTTKRVINPPAPFNTTAFLSAASSIGVSPASAMNTAESLYMKGYISYPRVDNTVYPESMDLTEIVKALKNHDKFGPVAQAVLSQKEIRPTRGKKKASDHPPIHPTDVLYPNKVSPREWKIYELVVRRYLATLLPQAEQETIRADIISGSEPFISRGQRILKEGWLFSYIYSRRKDEELPALKIGQKLKVAECIVEDKETQPPTRYGQGRLIEEMEKLGLGTKATRHSIIQNLYERGYTHGDPIEPTELGIAVSDSLQKHAYTITTPEMTSGLEQDMDEIAESRSTKEKVVDRSRDLLRGIMESLELKKEEVAKEIREGIRMDQIIGKCPKCGKSLRVMRAKKSKKRFVGCTGYPDCTNSYPLPQFGGIIATGETCPECDSPKVKIIVKGKRPWILCLDPSCPTKMEQVKVAKE